MLIIEETHSELIQVYGQLNEFFLNKSSFFLKISTSGMQTNLHEIDL